MAKLKVHHFNDLDFYSIYCPACKTPHTFNSTWGFNGDMDKPTVRHSLLVSGYRDEVGPNYRCHSFIRDGFIEYLGDCSHGMKNLKVLLPDIEEWENEY
jgi:hypothetical protein